MKRPKVTDRLVINGSKWVFLQPPQYDFRKPNAGQHAAGGTCERCHRPDSDPRWPAAIRSLEGVRPYALAFGPFGPGAVRP